VNIAYLVNTYPRASHTFIRRELQALERRGLKIHRFAMRSDRAKLVDADDKAEDARTEHVLESGAWRLLTTALGWKLTHPAAAWRAFKAAWTCGGRGAGGRAIHMVYLLEAAFVASRCKALGVQHLHAHFGTNPTTVAMLCHLMGGPRYSFTVHGPEEFDAPAQLSLGLKVRHSAFAVAISSFGRSQLFRWADFADWPKIQIVHCGIEPDRFPPPAPVPGAQRLVAIGRLSEQKGFTLLVEAMALAARRHPALHLVLVGDGELRHEIEASLQRHGITNRVTLAGWQDEAGVRRELAAADALILPSFAEGLPMVIMEAMAAGRPVIATSIAGIPELVKPQTGWLVPAGDPVALAEAIDQLIATPAQTLTDMGQAGRARVMERHAIDGQAQRLAALLSAS
jgi:glycosyltransferase involved in cell wall biosynthesis